MSLRWAFIGFGEAAEVLVASDLLGPANPTVILPAPRPVSAATQTRLRAAGIEPNRDGGALQDADVVISVVTPASALEVARIAGPNLRPGAFYVDANSISGRTARAIASVVDARSALFVDAALMGAVPLLRSSVPIYLSGASALKFADLLTPFGLQPTVVSERPGDASDVKMLWGIMSKGAIGLVAETLIAADRLGLTASVIKLLGDEFGRTGSPEMLLRMLESTARTGPRRLDELASVRETLASVEVPAYMVGAAEAWISRLSSLGTAQGVKTLDEAIKAAAADVRAQAMPD